jgi:hypothetical protein
MKILVNAIGTMYNLYLLGQSSSSTIYFNDYLYILGRESPSLYLTEFFVKLMKTRSYIDFIVIEFIAQPVRCCFCSHMLSRSYTKPDSEGLTSLCSDFLFISLFSLSNGYLVKKFIYKAQTLT